MTYLLRILFVLLAACILTGAAGATIIETQESPSPAQSAPLLQSVETLSVDPGESFPLAGTVTYYPSGEPAVGVQVDLQRQSPDGAWATVGSTRTDADGDYSFEREEPAAGVYRYHTLVNGQLLNEGWVVTIGSGTTTRPTTAPTTVPTTAPTTIPTTVPTTAPTTIPTTVPTTIPTTIPTTVPTTVVTTTAAPVVTASATPMPVTTRVSSRSTTFGRRYAIGNPGSFLGTRYSSPGTAPRMTKSRSVTATGTALKPGDRAYGLTPPTGQFIRWYPGARWATKGAGDIVPSETTPITTVPTPPPTTVPTPSSTVPIVTETPTPSPTTIVTSAPPTPSTIPTTVATATPIPVPTSGEISSPSSSGSLNRLTITNLNDDEGTFYRVYSSANTYTGYINPGDSLTITEVYPGTYTAFVQAGTGWNAGTQTFANLKAAGIVADPDSRQPIRPEFPSPPSYAAATLTLNTGSGNAILI